MAQVMALVAAGVTAAAGIPGEPTAAAAAEPVPGLQSELGSGDEPVPGDAAEPVPGLQSELGGDEPGDAAEPMPGLQSDLGGGEPVPNNKSNKRRLSQKVCQKDKNKKDQTETTSKTHNLIEKKIKKTKKKKL